MLINESVFRTSSEENKITPTTTKASSNARRKITPRELEVFCVKINIAIFKSVKRDQTTSQTHKKNAKRTTGAPETGSLLKRTVIRTPTDIIKSAKTLNIDRLI